VAEWRALADEIKSRLLRLQERLQQL
jgi:hypothetical protein